MATYGYARVSTADQTLDIQTAKLAESGCTVIRKEKVSGKSRAGRDELRTLLEFIQPGDVIVVTKLDRLGRSVRDVLNIVHEIEVRGATLRVLDQDINTAGATGKVVLHIFAMVAELELNLIRERQAAGIAAAKAKGRYKGRPRTIDYAEAIRLKAQGLGVATIARRLNTSRQSIYSALATA
jgi:DNA invertase Pin-like site-specific DNA recombinase